MLVPRWLSRGLGGPCLPAVDCGPALLESHATARLSVLLGHYVSVALLRVVVPCFVVWRRIARICHIGTAWPSSGSSFLLVFRWHQHPLVCPCDAVSTDAAAIAGLQLGIIPVQQDCLVWVSQCSKACACCCGGLQVFCRQHQRVVVCGVVSVCY